MCVASKLISRRVLIVPPFLERFQEQSTSTYMNTPRIILSAHLHTHTRRLYRCYDLATKGRDGGRISAEILSAMQLSSADS